MPILRSESLINGGREFLMSNLYSTYGDEPIFEIEEVSGILVLTMVEDPSSANYQSRQFESNRVRKQISDAGTRFLVFDLEHCTFLDSVTVGILIALTTSVRQIAGDAVMAAVSQDVAELLGRLMLLQPDEKRAMWTSFPSRRHAIEAINAGAN
ncbi:MAG: STAS domain-containing protein [Planctomycetota bacterium]|jgi:anti-anti-sigma regulatory factor